MKLHKIGLINWANLPIGEYEFDPRLNLITGHSAAGKTTIVDAVQTVMTAAKRGLFQYNPGQDETKQHSQKKETRSLASYVLGCDDGRYARPDGAFCHLIAVFRPDAPGERTEVLTAIVSVSARLEKSGAKMAAKEDVQSFALVKGEVLSCDHFMVSEGSRKTVVAPERVKEHFKKYYPDIGVQVCSGKEDYLVHLYGALQGKEVCNRIEAKASAKQISKFMAYKPMDTGLDEFVREEVLEESDMSKDVQKVASMMKSIYEMEQEAHLINEAVADLESMHSASSSLIKHRIKESLHRYESKKREEARLQREYIGHTTTRKEKLQQQEEARRNAKELRLESEQLTEKLITLRAQARGIDVLREKERLEQLLDDLQSRLTTLTSAVIQADQVRHQQRKIADAGLQALSLPGAKPPSGDPQRWQAVFSRVIEKDSWDQTTVQQWLQESSLDDITKAKTAGRQTDAAYSEMATLLRSAKEDIDQTFYDVRTRKQALDEEIKTLTNEIDRLETAGQITLPRHVDTMVKLIQQELPLANASVLCEHIEVRDPEWQLAIEGFMGNNRFVILVDEEYEREALSLVKREADALSRRHFQSSNAIIQGKKARRDSEGRNPPSDSIFHLLEFSHPTAEAYVKGSVGNVVTVTDDKILTQTPRGLTQDGKASGAYKMFTVRMNDEELVFGQNAKQLALQAKKKRLEALKEEQTDVDRLNRNASFWRTSLEDCRSPQIESSLQNLENALKEQLRVQGELDALDLSDAKELENEIQLTSNESERVNRELEEESNRDAVLNNDCNRLLDVINYVSDQKERASSAVEGEEKAIRRLVKHWPAIDVDEELEAIDKAATDDADSLFHFETSYLKRTIQATRTLQDASREFNLKKVRQRVVDVSGYFSASTDEEDVESVIHEFVLLTDLYRQVDSLLAQFRNDILAKHKHDLANMSKEFQDIFVNEICYKMVNAIRDGKSRLDMLNRRLQHIKFGDDRYKFTSEMVPQYDDYLRFFKEVTDSDFNDVLLMESDLTDESKQIFERIRNLLISDELDRSLIELNRIIDYRNYRSYDILKIIDDTEISLKSYGTGSGAQMETPSYVIKAAALSSALKFDQQAQSLRMVLIDESFAKLDDSRSKKVLDYLCTSLGLQVIFVAPNKSASIYYDQVNLKYDVSKSYVPEKVGELSTRVYVHTAWLKKEAINDLYDREKQFVSNRAENGELDFLDELEEQASGGRE